MLDDFSRPSTSHSRRTTRKPAVNLGLDASAFAGRATHSPLQPSPQSIALPPVPTHPVDPLDIPPEASKKRRRGSSRGNFFRGGWPLNRRQSFLAAAVVLLLIGGGIATALIAASRTEPPAAPPVSHTKTAPKPTTVASTLTGLQVEPAANQRPVLGVMIENSLEARPQSGLDQAGIVFEAIAEGGITRFLALFQDKQPDYIGPVRSIRPYYASWCMSFDCALAHAGGSPEGLSNLRTWQTKDLDQFANSNAYDRIRERYAPHNLYTTTTKLNNLVAVKGFQPPNYVGLLRKPDTPVQPTTTTAVNVAISGSTYNSAYEYNNTTNSYKRNQGGVPHMTVNARGEQTQIMPKVIVVIVVPYGISSDQHSQYTTTGTGEAIVFQDGRATPAIWNKTDVNTPFTLNTTDGAPLALNPGQTWITAVSARSLVTYK